MSRSDQPSYSVIQKPELSPRDIYAAAEAQVSELFDSEPVYEKGGLLSNLHLSHEGDVIGRDGLRYVSGRPDELEQNVQYQPVVAVGSRGRIGDYENLWKNSTFADGVSTVLEGLTSGLFALETHKEVPRAFRRQAEVQRKWTEATLEHLITDQFKWEYLQAPMIYGFSIWEIVGSPVTALKYIRQWTVDRWIFDENERLTAVKFAPIGSEAYTLPVEKLLIYSHLRSGTLYEGIPQLRFASPHIIASRELERLRLQAADIHATGYRIIETDAAQQDAGDSAELVSILDAARAKDGPVLELPAGRSFKLITPDSGLPKSFDGWIRYHDEKAALATGVKGSVAGTGEHSYASLDVMDRQGVRTATHYGHALARFITKDLIPLLVRQKFGESSVRPYPVLGYRRGREALDPARAGVLVQLIQNGLPMRPEDWDLIREEFRLPPISSFPDPDDEETDI